MIYLLNILLLLGLNDLNSTSIDLLNTTTVIKVEVEQFRPCVLAKVKLFKSSKMDNEPVGQIGEGCPTSSAWCAVEEIYDDVANVWNPGIISTGDPQIVITSCRIPCNLQHVCP